MQARHAGLRTERRLHPMPGLKATVISSSLVLREALPAASPRIPPKTMSRRGRETASGSTSPRTGQATGKFGEYHPEAAVRSKSQKMAGSAQRNLPMPSLSTFGRRREEIWKIQARGGRMSGVFEAWAGFAG